MTSRREAIIDAVTDAIAGVTTVTRDSDAPIDRAHTPHVIVRTAQAEPFDTTLNPLSWFMRMAVPVELYVSGTSAEERIARLDTLATAVYDAVIDDSPLKLLISHVEPGITDFESFAPEGSAAIQAAMMDIIVEYDAVTSIG